MMHYDKVKAENYFHLLSMKLSHSQPMSKISYKSCYKVFTNARVWL